MTETKKYNLAALSTAEKELMYVEMAAGDVAFKERYHLPIVAELVEQQQPEHLREHFRKTLMEYRAMKNTLGVLKTEINDKK